MEIALEIALFIFILLILLILTGLPIAISAATAGITWIIILNSSLYVIANRMISGINQFVLLAIPFFIFAGELMNRTKITDKIIGFLGIFLGNFKGGLAQINIYASGIFAGLTGSAVTDVSALGSVLIPAMEKEGYPRNYSAAITAGSSVLGPIIPQALLQ